MSEFLDRARQYHEAIGEILLREWDPIGIADEPAAQDEYDSYVAEIHGLLIRHEPRHRLLDHLWWIETEHMGLLGDRQRTELVVDRLIELREQVEAGSRVSTTDDDGLVGRLLESSPAFRALVERSKASPWKPFLGSDES